MKTTTIVGVIGEGAWGTAMATVLAHNGCRVKLWCHDPNVVETIKTKRVNERYLPGIELSDNIEPIESFKDLFDEATIIFEAVPVQYLRSIVHEAKPFAWKEQPWVVLSKGIDKETLLLPANLINKELAARHVLARAALMGPSFARDVAMKAITAVTLASEDEKLARELDALLTNEYFSIQHTNDLMGVQLCAALKNIVALASGMLEGASFAENTRACLITRCLHEIAVLLPQFGGQAETVYGLAGVGDLLLTATSRSSRNMEVGRRLGQGQKLEQILKETGYTPESINTVQALPPFLAKKHVKAPLLETICAVAQGKAVLNDLVKQLRCAKG